MEGMFHSNERQKRNALRSTIRINKQRATNLARIDGRPEVVADVAEELGMTLPQIRRIITAMRGENEPLTREALLARKPKRTKRRAT